MTCGWRRSKPKTQRELVLQAILVDRRLTDPFNFTDSVLKSTAPCEVWEGRFTASRDFTTSKVEEASP